MSRRIEQANATLQKAVQDVLVKGLSDPRAHALITVTSVRVTPDFQECFINVSVLPAQKQDLVLHALTDAASYIRREVGELVDARKLPRFSFRLDKSLKKQAGITEALNRAAQEREAKGIPPPPLNLPPDPKAQGQGSPDSDPDGAND